MKTIIAGSRTFRDMSAVEAACDTCPWGITQVVSGCARGVDTLGEIWAAAHNIPVDRFPANWDLYGKRAGMLRNAKMAECSEALIAVWDGESKGTAHMIATARKAGLKVHIYDPEPDKDFWG